LKILLTKAWLLALLLAVAFLLAACGSAGGGGQQDSGSAGDGEQGTTEKTGGVMAGMDHSNMDHGSMGMGSGEMARQMVMENGKYSDKAFIDAMIPHHQSAIVMAQVAYEKSENPEIKELAGNIVSAQQSEIEQMKQWREEWYPEG
jgi:uncharacterized protein (DUF305 family)